MNSAMMPQDGIYKRTQIDMAEFTSLIRSADEVVSYIGYDNVAALCSAITGKFLEKSRELSVFKEARATILVMKLKVRLDPSEKGRSEFDLNEYEFFKVDYKKVMDQSNFFHSSSANFDVVNDNDPDFVQVSSKEPDFVSCTPNSDPMIVNSVSKYWYTDKGVYRSSNHWGAIAHCYWALECEEEGNYTDVLAEYRKTDDHYFECVSIADCDGQPDLWTGFCSWENFTFREFILSTRTRSYDECLKRARKYFEKAPSAEYVIINKQRVYKEDIV